MSLWDRMTSEFIDVIDWPESHADQMVWRYERYGNEIKNDAKLTVRSGQMAGFVNEGEIADVFPPGLYRLNTANLPILSALQHWDHGFNSPFKAEVYFLSTRRFTDLKWGTKNPVMLRDPEFGPIRLRAFGNYSLRIADPRKFLLEIVGVRSEFSAEEITGQIRNLIVSRFAAAVGNAHIPVLDLAANYEDMGNFMRQRIAGDVAEYGLELVRLLIENISLPPAVEAALDRRSQMGIIGDLRRYAQFQAAESMRVAAENPGAAGAGMGMGMGAGMGMIWAQQMQQNPSAYLNAPQNPPQNTPQAEAPPPLPQAQQWYVALSGQSSGPHEIQELNLFVSSAKLNRDSLVWCQGMANWAKAGDLAELSALFRSAPPPLPI